MNKRIYAPANGSSDERDDENSAFSFNYKDLLDKSCRMKFSVPSQCYDSTQNDEDNQEDEINSNKTVFASRWGKKATKKVPVLPSDCPKKKHNKKHVLKEIKTYQNSIELLVPRKPFRRLCAEIARKQNPEIRFQQKAIDALQEATEAYLVGIFEDSQLCCNHAKRVTLMQKDVELANKIRK